MKYQLNIDLKDRYSNLASSKALVDCEAILREKDYKSVHFDFDRDSRRKLLSLLRLTAQLTSWVMSVKQNSLVLVQYPLIGVNRFFEVFIKVLKFKNCTVAALIHDIDSLRYHTTEDKVLKEIKWLNAYDELISHNGPMSKWLKSKGALSEIKDLTLFDYLFDHDNKVERSQAFIQNKYQVVYAGNLNRGKFIDKLSQVAGISFILYGPAASPATFEGQSNVTWKGIFSSEDIVAKLEGTFGLIWDGDSITSCEGLYGDYIRYNNPHKCSLYFAAGLPVIVPRKAAVWSFVENNKLGIGIDDLSEVPSQIHQISREEYSAMLSNVALVRKRLKAGQFLAAAVDSIEFERGLLKSKIQLN